MSWRGIKILKNRIHNQKNERVSRRYQKKRRNILGLIKPDFKNILKIVNIIFAYNIKTWKYTTHKCKAWWFFTKWTHMSNSVQFSCSVVSYSLQHHGLQHARPPYRSPTPGVYPNSYPLSRWCHPTTSILCCPLLLPPSIFPSIRVFSNESVLCIRWPKYWSFSFKFSPSDEHSGLISFRMNWLDLLAVQGTLKSLLQHHSSKASILWHSPFLIVQLWHL